LQGPQNTNLCEGESFTFNVDPNFANYQWFIDGNPTNDTGSSLQVNTSGSYSVQVTSADGCTTTTESIDLVFNTLPDAQLPLDQNQSLCNGDVLLLESPSDADTYVWTLNGLAIANTANFEVSDSGVYQLALTTSGCTRFSQEITVSISDELTVDFNFDTMIEICAGEVFSPGLTQNFDTYQWFLDGAPFSTDRDIDITEAGDYFLEVSSNACTGVSDAFSVLVNSLPIVETNFEGLVEICEGDSFTTNVTQDFDSYQWFLNGEPFSTDRDIEITDVGEYTLEVSSNSCIGVSDAFTVQVNDLPTVELNISGGLELCEGETIVAIVDTDASSLQWFFEGEPLPETGNELLISEEGVYELIAEENGCVTNSGVIDVQILPAPIAEIQGPSEITLCAGESVELLGNEGIQLYSWFLDGDLILEDDIPNLEVTESGTYTLVTTNGDCKSLSESEPVIVNVIELPNLSTIAEDSNLCAGEMMTVTAPAGQDTYVWTRDGEILSETGATLNISEAGSYQLEIQEGDCSTTSESFEVTAIEFASLDDLPTNVELCEGESTIVEAPAGADTYQWIRDGIPTLDDDVEFEISEAGTYELIVTLDACTFMSAEINAVVNALPTAIIEGPSSNDFFCEGATATLFSMESNVDNTFWFLDGNLINEGGLSIDITQSGEYTLMTQVGDCIANSEVFDCSNEAAILEVNDNPNFIYEWFFDNAPIGSSAQISVSTPGTYTVMAFDASTGCDNSIDVDVTIMVLLISGF